MATETISSRYIDVDGWPLADQLASMYEGQLSAIASIGPALPALAAAVEAASQVLGATGRLVYVGAGTSGRLAVLDGVELTPTFGWDAERTLFLMAGGMPALTRGIEGAEDDSKAGSAAMDRAHVGSSDVAIGVAASGRTPFTVAALTRARELGALTIGIANTPGTALLNACAHPVLIDTGAEIIAGSTRMKAGAAQKVVLCLMSSALMMARGHVYKGLMVDMRPTNIKLHDRACRIVARLAGVDVVQAADALDISGGVIKLAVLRALGVSEAKAKSALSEAQGQLRSALQIANVGDERTRVGSGRSQRQRPVR